MSYCRGSKLAKLPPRGHVAMSVGILAVTTEGSSVQISGGLRPGMLLSVLRCPGWSPTATEPKLKFFEIMYKNDLTFMSKTTSRVCQRYSSKQMRKWLHPEIVTLGTLGVLLCFTKSSLSCNYSGSNA